MRFLFFLLLLSSCFESGNSPESALRDFVESRLAKIVTREDLIERTTGKLRLSIESMEDADFIKMADLRDFKKDSFRIINKSCQDKKCYVTYSLGYHQGVKGKAQWTTEVKKISELLFIDGKWLIADVSNIKTYHESTEVIEVTP